MPGQYLTPGVYVEEVPSSVRPITGVSTSATAFVDVFNRGPSDRAVRIGSWGDFERIFGGLDRRSEASYAIAQFFANGGSVAWVVRVAPNGAPAAVTLDAALTVTAIGAGTWGDNVFVGVDTNVAPGSPGGVFNLVVREFSPDGKEVLQSEVYRNVSTDPSSPRFVDSVVGAASSLVTCTSASPAATPTNTGTDVIASRNPADFRPLINGNDGDGPEDPTWEAGITAAVQGNPALSTGMHALDLIAPDVFNLFCLPVTTTLSDANAATLIKALATYCYEKRAFFIADPPADLAGITNPKGQVDRMKAFVAAVAMPAPDAANAAFYYPLLNSPDALNQNRPRVVGPSGTLAGVYARTDSTRGVWKAPAGTEAGLRGATVNLAPRDDDDAVANPLGINALRSFPVFGNVVWGARTAMGADVRQSEWKYVPVRRTALYLEESLFQGLRWTVFEPNDEPLWAQIRLNVGAFLHNLFRQGAFQGRTPKEAYFVKCDSETTTQADIDLGIVRVLVGFAPLKPAEFVIIRIQQMTRPLEV